MNCTVAAIQYNGCINVVPQVNLGSRAVQVFVPPEQWNMESSSPDSIERGAKRVSRANLKKY
jgi:hypothetical protein